MKKKLLWCVGIVVLIVLIALGVFRYIEVRHRQTDAFGADDSGGEEAVSLPESKENIRFVP